MQMLAVMCYLFLKSPAKGFLCSIIGVLYVSKLLHGRVVINFCSEDLRNFTECDTFIQWPAYQFAKTTSTINLKKSHTKQGQHFLNGGLQVIVCTKSARLQQILNFANPCASANTTDKLVDVFNPYNPANLMSFTHFTNTMTSSRK